MSDLRASFYKVSGRLIRTIVTLLLLHGATALAAGNFVVSPNLQESSTSASYLLTVPSCHLLDRVEVQAGDFNQSYLADYDPMNNRCEFAFIGSGGGFNSPSAKLVDKQGTEQTVAETFAYETERPSLTLEDISIATAGDSQQLVLRVTAADDTDISYLTFSATGLFASKLREVGGVIDLARESAFAQTDGVERIIPLDDNQTEFVFSLPISLPLSGEQIASDGVVLYDIVTADSSGNQSSVSGISFTGEDVNEEILGIALNTQEIIISNALEVIALVPSIDFQFRGLTPRPGRNQGFSYSSSHPNLVSVDADGLLRPLAETDGEAVTITVEYAGQAPLSVPVEVDYSKLLDRLEFDIADSQLTIGALNKWTALPAVNAIFTDDDVTAVNSNIALEYSVSPEWSAILEVNDNAEILAKSVIEPATPAILTVAIASRPEIRGEIPVVSQDALPTISLELPARTQVGDELVLEAVVDDDVAIRDVRYFLDDARIAIKSAPPYALRLPVDPALEGRSLNFSAEVFDSAGQSNRTDPVLVVVQARSDDRLPQYTLESPGNLQVVIEGTEFLVRLSRKIDLDSFRRKVKFVEVFLDGARLGITRSPSIESELIGVDKDGRPEYDYYSVWQYLGQVPLTSTNETSKSLQVRLHGFNGETFDFDTLVLKILKNRAPDIVFEAPVEGSAASIGTRLPVVMLVSDDTLAQGTRISLFANNQLIDEFLYEDQEQIATDAFELQTTRRSIRLPIVAEWLGSDLSLVASATDVHGLTRQTEPLLVGVNEDQPPQVSITYPQEGQQLTFGIPIEFRADALDDVSVSRVDFFLNDRLVGSDAISLYSHTETTDPGRTTAQSYQVYAVAYDSDGQSTKSQIVTFSMGADEVAPVVNIAAPLVSGTDNGVDIAEVTEDSTVVFKVTGYDNVGIDTLTVTGIRQQGSGFLLTGDPVDQISGDQFAPQLIPQTINAYSALKLVTIPSFSGLNVEFDRYPVEVLARDLSGNSSLATLDIAVSADRPPVIVDAIPNRQSYLPQDTIEINVQAQDDRNVVAVVADFLLEETATLLRRQVVDLNNGLIPGENVQIPLRLDLSEFGLANAGHGILVNIHALDNRNQSSRIEGQQDFELELAVVPDLQAPVAAILSPIQGSQLYHGENVTFSWRSLDQSDQSDIRFKVDGNVIHESILEDFDGEGEIVIQRSESGAFNYRVPASGSTLTVAVIATDVYQNTSTSSWIYDLGGDSPPTASIRTPAAGERLIEGESFTISTLASDDRKVEKVELLIESDGVVIDTYQFSSRDIVEAVDNGNYLAASMRVPTRAGTSRVGVRVVDSSDQEVFEFVDIEVLDDNEAPLLVMSDPLTPVEIYPGQRLDIAGNAEDNLFVTGVTPVLIDGNGDETLLGWEVYSQESRVESETVPNPITFGEIIVSERFYLDFEGKMQLPLAFTERAGEVFRLVLRARDNGINTVETPPIIFKVKVDDQPPEIMVNSPEGEVVEQVELPIRIELTDDVQLDSYRVSLVDGTESLLFEGDELNRDRVSVNGNFDLDTFDPIPAQGKVFALRVRAADLAGNESIVDHKIVIRPDTAPGLTVVDAVSDSLTQGGVDLFSIESRDDYRSGEHPVIYLPISTSLGGLGADGNRSPRGLVLGDGFDDSLRAGNYSPAIEIGYPESGGLATSLKLGEADLLGTDGDRLTVYPFTTSAVGSGSVLQLDAGPDYRVSYRVVRAADAQCMAPAFYDQTFDDGVPWSYLVAAEAVSSVIYPQVTRIDDGSPVEFYLQSIRLDRRTLENLSAYEANQVESRRIEVQSQLSYQIAETDAYGVSRSAYISTRNPVRSTGQGGDVRGQVFPNLVDNDYQRTTILAHAVDSFSHRRGEIALQPLRTVNVFADAGGPSIQIRQPANGRVYKPLSRMHVEVDTSNNDELLESVGLYLNGKLVSELAGLQQQDRFHLRYDIPPGFSGGSLDALVVATDANGLAASERLTFPLTENLPPQIDLAEFAAHRVIDTPERLNNNEFWVRIGSQFKMTIDNSDDVDLSRFEIWRMSSSAADLLEYDSDYPSACPAVQVTEQREIATIPFQQIESTEYEMRLYDTFGNLTRRNFVVHPLDNYGAGNPDHVARRVAADRGRYLPYQGRRCGYR